MAVRSVFYYCVDVDVDVLYVCNIYNNVIAIVCASNVAESSRFKFRFRKNSPCPKYLFVKFDILYFKIETLPCRRYMTTVFKPCCRVFK